MSRKIAILALLGCLAVTGNAADMIELASGKTVKGTLAGRQSIYVSLNLSEGASEAVVRLKPSEINRIHFSDSSERDEFLNRYSASDPYQATVLLERLVRNRLPYMDLLSRSDELLFTMLLESYIQSGRAEVALDRAKLWRTKLRSKDIIDQIEELQIMAATNTGDLDEASFYSKRWIDSGKSARETALPWNTLAEDALAQGAYESALWLSLNPIVFTHPHNPRFLANAYEIAIFSAYQLQEFNYARQLHSEMMLRNLTWPIESERADVLVKLENLPSSPTLGRPGNPPPSHNPSPVLHKVAGKP